MPNEWLYGFLLGFGQHVEVLEPMHIRQRIKDIAFQIYTTY
ncbi:WYL domain-containing protein [Effusibacillus lacus]|nr:WYL domain-containing protein [Effusibacillus lacus]